MVPPVPPPTIKILIAFSFQVTRHVPGGRLRRATANVLFRLANLDVPNLIHLFTADHFVPDLVDPPGTSEAVPFVG